MNPLFPTPREFQRTAQDELRKGFKAGHTRQMLMAPTGSGKTVLAMLLINDALEKGRRATFVCDRTTLIDQTSAVADSLGLTNHGIIQASHWRTDYSKPFQIASAQTLARRKWPASDIIIVDEAHTSYSSTTEHLRATEAAVIGLSATPFSKGLGLTYSNLVNATTMADLVDQGVLVPMKVLACTPTNMEGAETAGGEWTERAAAERGMQIVGDVVSEWLEHGQGRKTIVFGATIAHCEELCRQFISAGVMAAVFTAETSAADRAELLKEYRKPDSTLRVLISVEALAKGFDVQDVSCVVDCRPLRKSLSTAIQMWGRGLRSTADGSKSDCILLDHCIATGQRVLTHRGLVRIEEILLTDKLWDGHDFVAHKGVVSRGIKSVIQYAGLTATADHPVKTALGWRTLGQCADEQTPIVTTGVGRTALWERDGHFTRHALAGAAGAAIRACALRVRHLWLSFGDFVIESKRRANKGLQDVQSTRSVPEVAVCASAQHETAVHQSEGSPIQGLWGPGDRVPFRLRDHLRTVGSGQPGNSDRAGVDGTGSEGQQWSLRAGQHQMVNPAAEHEQHPRQQVDAADAQVQNPEPGGALRGRFFAWVSGRWNELRGNCRTMGQAVAQTEREVWDILDCGPRNSFTCEGLLVHNSGNIQRFKEDFENIYFNGLDKLDGGEKLDKKVREEPTDAEKKGCPSCGHQPFFKRCMSCGFELVKDSGIVHQPGQMREIMIGKQKAADDVWHLWQQAVAYARTYSKPEKQRGRAAHIFKEIAGHWPPNYWSIESTPAVEISRPVFNKIRSRNIARAKGAAKGVRA